jgi:hypothetical protein
LTLRTCGFRFVRSSQLVRIAYRLGFLNKYGKPVATRSLLVVFRVAD